MAKIIDKVLEFLFDKIWGYFIMPAIITPAEMWLISKGKYFSDPAILGIIILFSIGLTFWIINQVRNYRFNKQNKNNKPKNNHEDIEKHLVNQMREEFFPTKLTSKLRDGDIEKMADGKFNTENQTFIYNKLHFDEYCYQFRFNGFLPIKKGEEQQLWTSFLPSIAKTAIIYFELEDDCKKHCKIYIINNEKPLLVENISLPQCINLNSTNTYGRFIVDFEENSFDYKKAYINVRVKSFSI